MPGYEKGVTPPMSDDTRPVGTFNNFGSTDYEIGRASCRERV